MSTFETAVLQWRKSSSCAANGTCVELAASTGRRVAVRDGADEAGPILVFTTAEWRAFTAAVRRGNHDPAD